MRHKLRILLTSLLILALLCANACAAAQATAGLNLPKSLEVIDAEAFLDTAAAERLVVSEGTREIRSRAFAHSGLREVYLPASVETIADDAFEGCENLTVYAPKGSYAHQWLIFSNMAYVAVQPEGDAPYYSVTGVTIFTETDAETGEAQLCIGANVTANRDCLVSLRINDDEGVTNLLRADLPVTAPVEDELFKAPVSIELPEYYTLEAVLVDESEKALCEPCVNRIYTSAYAQVQQKTAADYPAEQVLDFGSSGYAVLAPGVRKLNVSASFDGENYTFSTSEELSRGDVIQLTADGLAHVIKIGSISRSGNSVTVTADENVYLSELFDAVHVDGSFVRGASAGSARTAGSPLISLNQTFKLDPLEFAYQLDVDVHMTFTYDKHWLDDYVLDVNIDTDAHFKGSLAAEIDTFKDNMHNGGSAWRIPIISEIVMLPGIYLPTYMSVSIPLNIKTQAAGTFGMGCETTYGFTISEANGLTGRKKDGDKDAELKFEGDLEIAIGPEISFTASLFKAIEAKVGAQFGPKLTGTLHTPSYGGTTADKVHACYACLDADIYAVADVRATVIYEINEWMEGSLLDAKIAAYEKYLGGAFASIFNDKESIYGGKFHWGWDDCQNYKYRTTIDTVDMYARTVGNIPLTISRTGCADVTGVSQLKTYLYKGSYTAKAGFGSGIVSEAFAVEDEAQSITVYEPGINLVGYVTDYTTGKAVSGASVSIAVPGNRTLTIETDKNGYYIVKGAPYGQMSYVVTADRYEDATRTVRFIEGKEGRIDFELEPIVPDPAGTPFAMVQVKKQSEDIDVQGWTFSDAYVYDMRYTGDAATGSIGEVTFNLRGDYSTISFDAGRYTGWERDAVMKIYGDGVLLQETEMKYTDAPRHYSVSVGGVKQLVIRMESYGYDYTRYAIGNISLSPKADKSERVLYSDANINSWCGSSSQVNVESGAFSMGGNNYYGGYYMYMGANWCTNTAILNFNLNGAANTFSFDIAKHMRRIPEAYISSAYITIMVDGVVQSGFDARELKWNDLVLPVSLNVAGANELQIKLNYYAYDRGYWGIGNVHVR